MITILINSVDLSDHVVKCDRIPVCVRNRDFSPVAEGFGFSLGWSVAEVPEVGETVAIFSETTPIYLGFIERVSTNYDELTYDIEVINALYKLEKVVVSFSELAELIRDVVAEDETECTFDPSPSSVNSHSHGLVDDDCVALFTDGTLPTGLEANRQYYVKRLDADNFQVKEYLGSSTGISFTGTGTGTHHFRFVDHDLFCFRDNENAPSIKLSWLLKNIFQKVGLTLDLTASETITLHTETISGTAYNYDLRSIAIDENMFYCLNQDVAMSYTVIDDTASDSSYSTNKITLWEFISAVCSAFGFAIGVKDESPFTFELVKSSLTVTVTDNNTFSRVDETIIPSISEGYTVFRKYWNVRSAYQSTTPTDIEEHDKNVVEGGKEEVTVLNNLRFFLRDIRAGQPNGKLLATDTYEFPFSKQIERQITLMEDNHLQKKIVTTMRFDMPMVLENYIDAEKLTSEIVQENII